MPRSSALEKDQRKIDNLNKDAWAIRITDSNKAFDISKKALGLAKKLNYTKGIAEALRNEGFVHMRMANYERSLSVLEEATNLFESLNDVRGVAPAYEYIGIVQRNLGNGTKALENIFKALDLSRQTSFSECEATALYHLGVTYRNLANYEKALDYLYESLSMCRFLNYDLIEAYNLQIIGTIYFETGAFQKALEYFHKALTVRNNAGDKWGEAGSLYYIGFTHMKLNHLEEAKLYCQKSLDMCQTTGDKKGEASALFHLSGIFKDTGDEEQAASFGKRSLEMYQSIGDKRGEAEIIILLASLEKHNTEHNDRLLTALTISKEIKANDLLSKTRYLLYQRYHQAKDYKKAIDELESYVELENELHKDTINQKILNLEITYKVEQERKEAEEILQRNMQLTKLNKEIKSQKQKIEEAYDQLTSTQSQLIQSEKMASLGELTAGIAHEIQNPLNFVNNFSEVSGELVEELKDERSKLKAERDESLEEEILDDITQNLEKINHHGQRASGIVKGMLEHSHTGDGVKELTDINKLADEYLRLAFHGLRAKDKSFNADFKMEFDEALPKINVVPQDIGRVLLNLINNAFFAVSSKLEAESNNYRPEVIVSTKIKGGSIEISVKDNGPGIPAEIKDKIFQPFFTTKPTGSGTGLGLSLSYDIINAHGGEIKLENKPQSGTKFIIFLPITNKAE